MTGKIEIPEGFILQLKYLLGRYKHTGDRMYKGILNEIPKVIQPSTKKLYLT